jgi:hypothetical protein
MAIKTRKPAAASAERATTEESGVTNVTVGRSFTIPGDGEYESQKVQILVSASDYETASSLVDQYMTTEFERSSEQFRQFREASDQMAEDIGAEDAVEEGAEEGGEEGAEEGAEIGPDDIRAMSRKELEAINAEYELGLELSDYAKTKKGNANFAEAIIAAAGLEDEDGEEGEADEAEAEGEDDETGETEGEEEEGETGEEEEGDGLTASDVRELPRSELLRLNKEHELGIKTKPLDDEALADAVIEALGLDGEGPSEEDIRAMSRSELVAFVKENELGIATKNYPKLTALQDAVLEALGGEEEAGDEEEETAEEDETEETEEEAGEEEGNDEDESSGYQRSELEAMKVSDLKAIWQAWEIKDKFPTGSDPVIKKKAVNRIMRFQDVGK